MLNRKYFHKIILLFFGCVISSSAFSMNDFPGVLPAADVETWELARTYRQLCLSYNNDQGMNNALTDFEEGVFLPIPQGRNPSAFLNRARGTRDRITNEVSSINPLRPYFSKIIEEQSLSKLKNRIDLARLDENIFQGFGSLGGLNNFANVGLNNAFNDVNLRGALSTLTGRIFQINFVNNAIDINNSSVLSTSSGTLIDWNPFAHQINNLLPLANTPLNSVLTCAHSLSIEEGRAKAYFIPTNQLDLTNGFPVGVNNLNGANGLIDFLENNANSYPLSSLDIKNNTPLLPNPWRNYQLDMGQPQFFENEDLVIGNINAIGRNPLAYNANWTVSFQQNNVNGMNNGDRYFATGYPGCDHYTTVGLPNLIQNEGLSPFFITSTLNNMLNPTMNVNGSIDHRSPCAAGMSGGALFHFAGVNQINIFGVITSGEDINEQGCHWH
jgi:hypothetical protein